MKKEITIDDFSPHLFWDVDKATFDLNTYKVQMIGKVLEFGNWNDWKLLISFYGLETIKEVALNLRSLDAVTLSYLSALFNIDKTNFRCYKHRQLVQNSWNS
ncbi:hypothetical protein J2X31_003514 [Flavobacterium arsenatis]|uniref:DUF6922 domain-containing protein n=1 Tax=Flavobacterium arsenatis TaxID=1484332 RepID=A0ABU1TUE3_9FLAO|nr:hypothetical protein [Flavobacterium arsenatis]MDR6969483.1 hypothetical protein [Flavobacterium arsenatis]